jgi:hypothetical protein
MNCFYCQQTVVNGYEICDTCFDEKEQEVMLEMLEIEQSRRPASPVPCFYCNGKVVNGYEICDECFYAEEEKADLVEKEIKEILDHLEPSLECVMCLGHFEELKDDVNMVCELCLHILHIVSYNSSEKYETVCA